MPDLHDVVPSTVNPAEMHLLVRVSADSVLERPALVNGYTLGTTTLKDMPIQLQPRNTLTLGDTSLGNTVLTTVSKDNPGMITFRFAPARTAAQRLTPFRSLPNQEVMHWPMVICTTPDFTTEAGITREGIYQGTLVYQPQGLVRYRIKLPWQGMTRQTVNYYLSNTPWTDEEMVCTELRPKAVDWNYYGDAWPFPNVPCLHPRIQVPAQTILPTAADGSLPGTASARHGTTFDATLPTDWAQIEHNTQQFIESEGVHLRIQTLWHPPPDGETYRND